MAFKIKRFISPLHIEEDPKKPNSEKPKAAKDVKGFDEQFETVKAKYPQSIVTRRKGKLGSYTVRTGTGSFGYTPGKRVD
jgi:hypothetical protein